MANPELSDRDYRALAEVRHRLRAFVAFSEASAREIGLEPRQHQVLLALRGLPEDLAPTVGALAGRLVLRHHTVVGLVDRLEAHGLVRRGRGVGDRRQVRVALTRQGRDTLRRLSLAHRDELARSAPALIAALRSVLRRS